jgi:hypothetical protein
MELVFAYDKNRQAILVRPAGRICSIVRVKGANWLDSESEYTWLGLELDEGHKGPLLDQEHFFVGDEKKTIQLFGNLDSFFYRVLDDVDIFEELDAAEEAFGTTCAIIYYVLLVRLGEYRIWVRGQIQNEFTDVKWVWEWNLWVRVQGMLSTLWQCETNPLYGHSRFDECRDEMEYEIRRSHQTVEASHGDRDRLQTEMDFLNKVHESCQGLRELYLALAVRTHRDVSIADIRPDLLLELHELGDPLGYLGRLHKYLLT